MRTIFQEVRWFAVLRSALLAAAEFFVFVAAVRALGFGYRGAAMAVLVVMAVADGLRFSFQSCGIFALTNALVLTTILKLVLVDFQAPFLGSLLGFEAFALLATVVVQGVLRLLGLAKPPMVLRRL